MQVKLSEEQVMANISYALDQALDFVLADDSEFEKLDSDYEYIILKKNEKKPKTMEINPVEIKKMTFH